MPPVSPNLDCAARMRSGKLNSSANSTARVGAMRVAARAGDRGIESGRAAHAAARACRKAPRRGLHFHVHVGTQAHIDHVGTTRARFDGVDVTGLVDDAFTVQQARPPEFSSSPGVRMVVPNDTGSSPSAGWCSMYSSGASTATRSSLSTCESRPARMMLHLHGAAGHGRLLGQGAMKFCGAHAAS